MSLRLNAFLFSAVFIVVVASLLLLKHWRNVSDMESENAHSTIAVVAEDPPSNPQELRQMLDAAQSELAQMRNEYAQSDITSRQAAEIQAAIDDTQTRLAGLESDSPPPAADTQALQDLQASTDLSAAQSQSEMEQQVADLDASIADLNSRGADEEKIANLRNLREQVIRKMDNMTTNLAYNRALMRRKEEMEDSKISSERGELLRRLEQLHRDLAALNPPGEEKTPATLHALEAKITAQENLVKRLESRLRDQVR